LVESQGKGGSRTLTKKVTRTPNQKGFVGKDVSSRAVGKIGGNKQWGGGKTRERKKKFGGK